MTLTREGVEKQGALAVPLAPFTSAAGALVPKLGLSDSGTPPGCVSPHGDLYLGPQLSRDDASAVDYVRLHIHGTSLFAPTLDDFLLIPYSNSRYASSPGRLHIAISITDEHITALQHRRPWLPRRFLWIAVDIHPGSLA